MKFIADLHIHSKYSRATSKDMDIDHIAEWAKLKGIDLIGTGDFTHPLWVDELKDKLKQDSSGLYEYKGVKFIPTAEVSNMYTKNGSGRRIHTVLLAPDLGVVEEINKKLASCGNIVSDGRPIFGFDVKDIVKICLDISQDCLIVPAHCLLPDTYIHTKNKMVKIKDIKAGDYVYTHNLRWRRVKQIYKREYKGKIIYIKPYYFRLGLKTTPEHPYYVIKTFKNCPSTSGFCRPACSSAHGCKRRYFEKYKPQWVQAKDLKNSDIIVYPRFNHIRAKKCIKISNVVASLLKKHEKVFFKGSRSIGITDKIAVDENFCRLVGYYLAEGYADQRDSVSFCFRSDEDRYISDVKKLVKKIFGVSTCREYKRKNVNSKEIIFYSKVLTKFFSKLFYCDKDEKKHFTKALPYWMLELPFSEQAEIIKGWWRGDGGYTSSAELMNQMKILFLRLGIIPSILVDSVDKHMNRGKHFLGGREIVAKYDNYHFNNLSFFEDKQGLLKEPEFRRFRTKMARRHGWIDERYIYMPIRDVHTEPFQGTVYNLEVSTDNSYVAEFATVHNCWTPWFSVFGSNSGFDSVEECFEEEAENIHALETGLSSDPAMNWRLSALDKYNLISNSDAHSPAKLGREVNVFDTELSYKGITRALKKKDKNKFLFTVEFFPEEGKYHYDGHRNCGVRFSPSETKAHNKRCPKCGRQLTVGVMSRVDELADRAEGFRPEEAVPFKSMVPLQEIIAEAKQKGPATKGVIEEYRKAIGHFGNEFNILLDANEGELSSCLPEQVARAIIKMRKGELVIEPGYDGVFGTVKIFNDEELKEQASQQLELF